MDGDRALRASPPRRRRPGHFTSRRAAVDAAAPRAAPAARCGTGLNAASSAAADALAWTSETLGSLGLVGAMLVPVPIAIQGDELSAVGVAFAALVLIAATIVAVNRDWRGLLIASIVATAPQAIAIQLDHHAFATELAIAFWLVYGAGATWLT